MLRDSSTALVMAVIVTTSPGCWFSTSTETRTHTGPATVTERRAGTDDARLDVELFPGRADVVVWMKRSCVKTTRRQQRTVTKKTVDFDMVDLGGGSCGGEACAVFMGAVFAVAIVTGTLSGLFTAIEMAVSKDKVKERTLVSHEKRDCSTPVPGARVRLMRGGKRIGLARTNELGQARLPIRRGPGLKATIVVDGIAASSAVLRRTLDRNGERWYLRRPPGQR